VRTTHAIKTAKAHAKAEPQADQTLEEKREFELAPVWRSLALSYAPPFQKKLVVSQPNDPHELEADQIADRVMRVAEPSVQRKCSACTEEDEEKFVHRQVSAAHALSCPLPAEVYRIISETGEPLPEATRVFMESRFGMDLTNVRIHTGDTAGSSARALAARAYTVGNHVVFGPGQFAPAQYEGGRLLAHELAHVAQQTGNASKPMAPSITPPARHRAVSVNSFNAGNATALSTRRVQPHVARDPDPALEMRQMREEAARRAIEFIESMQRSLAADRARARIAATRAGGRGAAGRAAHPILNQSIVRTYIIRVRGIYDAQRTLLDPNGALLGDMHLAYANFLGEAREALDQTTEIRSNRPQDPAEEAAFLETQLIWLEASPLRAERLTGRTTFTAADVTASQRQETDVTSVLPVVIARILPTVNLVQPGASARLRSLIEGARTRITAPASGPPARTTATGPVPTAADAVLNQINGAEQAIERGRVLLRAAIASLDVWLNAPTQPNNAVTRVDELFHTQDPGYGRLLHDRIQLMLTNLEGSGTLIIRLHTPDQAMACTTPSVLGERTAPYNFVFCSISPNVDSNAGVLLHELAHAVIPGRGTRGSAAVGFPVDRAYAGERLMLRMTTEEALNNAESYSHLIRVLAGLSARPPRADTATACTDANPLLDALALAEAAQRRAWSYLDDVQLAVTAGRAPVAWVRTLIDTHLSTPADPLMLEILRDFSTLQSEGTIWHIPHTFNCLTARECPANAIALDNRRVFRDGSVTSRRGRAADTGIRICPGFFALAGPNRARAAYAIVSLSLGDGLLLHPDRIWSYASLALEIYTSDLSTPPASSLAEHQAADAPSRPVPPGAPPATPLP